MTDHPDPTALRLEGQRLVEATTKLLKAARPHANAYSTDNLIALADLVPTLLQSLAALTEERDRLREAAMGWRTDIENAPAYPAKVDLWVTWEGKPGHRFPDCQRSGGTFQHWIDRDGKYVEQTVWYDYEGEQNFSPDPDHVPTGWLSSNPRIERRRILAWRSVPDAPTLAQTGAGGVHG